MTVRRAYRIRYKATGDHPVITITLEQCESYGDAAKIRNAMESLGWWAEIL